MGAAVRRGPLRALGAVLRVDAGLLRHSSALFLATILGQLLAFGAQIVLARRIGIESYGLYAYAFTWIGLLALLATFGNDRLLVRSLGEYRAQGEHGLLRGVLRWAVLGALAASLAVGLAYAALRAGLDPAATASPERAGVLLLILATVPLAVLAALTGSALRGLEAHAAATWPSRVLRPLLFALLVLVVVREGAGHDARHGLALNALALLLAAVPALAALWRRLPARPRGPAPPLPVRSWLAASAAFGLHTLALNLNTQADMLVLGFFATEAELGAYGAVSRVVAMVSVASVAVVAVVQPMIVAARAQGRDLAPLVRGGARLVALASAGAVAVILLAADDLLAVFGEEFRSGATALRVLSVGWLVGGLFSLAGPLLNMTGHERDATAIMAAGAALSLGLNLLLAPRFGIEGAAAATAVSAVAWNLGLFLAARARVGVTAFPVRLPGDGG